MRKIIIRLLMILIISTSYAKPKNCKYWGIYYHNNAAAILRLCPIKGRSNNFSYLLYAQSNYDEKKEYAYPSESEIDGLLNFKHNKAYYKSEDNNCIVSFVMDKNKDYVFVKDKLISGDCGFGGKRYRIDGTYERLKGEEAQIPNEEN